MTGYGEDGKPVELREWGKNHGSRLQDLSKATVAELVEIADKVGCFLVKGKYLLQGREQKRALDLKVNQIRRFLDAVRRIESKLKGKRFEEVKDSIVLLRPKLAYAAGREEKVFPLMNVLDPAIRSGAQSKENFTKLLRLIEGIIAYHRFYGGKD